jgi:hypothetical protein
LSISLQENELGLSVIGKPCWQAAFDHFRRWSLRVDTLAVVTTKVSIGLEVRSKPPGEPHQLNIALRLTLQASA